ncbi:hypothetical protein AQJ30_15370 [Streptomyces longwoodensis]|uniref:Uncharacterized protein n=1 Tax=Streptomyces longwoodensis TaxID=68231 RepID=A0A117QN84_9ACTN|nr:hypothetical protein [Streptomyces longwoodensis]KUN37662.1 hypothetical protein AQJ30_15370 [Streptomyces longwoodensis]
MEETKRYYRNPDGTVRMLGGVNFTPPLYEDEGVQEITKEEFDGAVAAHRAEQQRRAREQEAAEQAEAHGAYDMLRALPGITNEVASRLTGYHPPEEAVTPADEP